MGWFKKLRKMARCGLTGGTSACANLYKPNAEKYEEEFENNSQMSSSSPAMDTKKIGAIMGGIIGGIVALIVISFLVRKYILNK